MPILLERLVVVDEAEEEVMLENMARREMGPLMLVVDVFRLGVSMVRLIHGCLRAASGLILQEEEIKACQSVCLL